MNMIRTRKTCAGFTPAQILADARISRMAAGTFAVTTPRLPGCILEQVEASGNLVVAADGGALGQYRLSDDEAATLSRLIAECEQAYSRP